MKILRRLLIGMALLYSAVLLYFIIFQESLLFYPEDQNFDDCPDMSRIGAETKHLDPFRYYELRHPSSRGTLVYFHGNAGSSCGRASRIEVLSKSLDLDVMIPEYPGFSNDSKSNPTQKTILSNMTEFVKKVVLQEKGPLFFIGVSLGSGVANYIASQFRSHGLILVSPFYSIDRMGWEHYPFVPISLLNRNPFPSNEWAKNVRDPVIIFHGNRDQIIPFTQGEELTREFKGAEFYEIDGARHDNMFSDFGGEVLPIMNRFVTKNLRN